MYCRNISVQVWYRAYKRYQKYMYIEDVDFSFFQRKVHSIFNFTGKLKFCLSLPANFPALI